MWGRRERRWGYGLGSEVEVEVEGVLKVGIKGESARGWRAHVCFIRSQKSPTDKFAFTMLYINCITGLRLNSRYFFKQFKEKFKLKKT